MVGVGIGMWGLAKRYVAIEAVVVDIGYSIERGLVVVVVVVVEIVMDSNFEDEIVKCQLMREVDHSPWSVKSQTRRGQSQRSASHFGPFSYPSPRLTLLLTTTMTSPTSDTKNQVIVTYQDHPRLSCAQCAAVVVCPAQSTALLALIDKLKGTPRRTHKQVFLWKGRQRIVSPLLHDNLSQLTLPQLDALRREHQIRKERRQTPPVRSPSPSPCDSDSEYDSQDGCPHSR